MVPCREQSEIAPLADSETVGDKAMRFNCPKCHERVEVDESFTGQVADCPTCSNPITIPESGEAPVLRAIPLEGDETLSEFIESKSPVARSFGIYSLVCGVAGIIFGLFGGFGSFLAVLFALVGGICAAVGFLAAAFGRFHGWGKPILGGILCIVALEIPFSSQTASQDSSKTTSPSRSNLDTSTGKENPPEKTEVSDNRFQVAEETRRIPDSIDPITPDQELYNNLVFFEEILDQDPVAVGFIQEELRKFDTTALSVHSVVLLTAMKKRCDEFAQIQRGIEYLVTDGEKAVANRSLTDGIEGGLTAAEVLSQLDYASDGEIDGGYLLYTIAGLVGGAVNHHAEGEKIRDGVYRDVLEEQEKQKAVLALLDQDMNRFKRHPSFSDFDESKLYRPGLMATVPKDSPQSYLTAIRSRNVIGMRIAVLNTRIDQFAHMNLPDPRWVEFTESMVAEWPTCLDKNHPVYSRALCNLSYAALIDGNTKTAEMLASEAINCGAKNDLAYNNRAVARLREGRGEEALKDVEIALAITPPESLVRVYEGTCLRFGAGRHERITGSNWGRLQAWLL